LANQIGQSYFDKQLNWLEHKTLHALLGGLSGGVSSKLFGGSFERGAISGALGAVVAEAVAEMLKPDLTNEMISSQNKNLSKDEFEKEFMEKAQQSSKWADFVGSVSAFGMGLDTNIAYQTSSNATQNNFLPGILLALTVGSTVYEGYQIHQTYKNEGGEAALKHLGITVVSAAVVGGIATVGFKVGKAVYPSLHEAYKAAVASRPMLASALTALESRLAKIEAYVKDQFDYKKHFVSNDKIKVNLDPKNSHAHELYKQELQKLDLTHGFTTQERNAVMRQLQEMQAGKSTPMAGYEQEKVINDIKRIVDTYGSGDWVKIKSLSHFKRQSGETLQLHGYQNLTTGEIFGLKIKKQ
jgi:hypothetical protein